MVLNKQLGRIIFVAIHSEIYTVNILDGPRKTDLLFHFEIITTCNGKKNPDLKNLGAQGGIG